MKTEIKIINGLFVYVIDGEPSGLYDNEQDCMDDMENRIAEINRENNDYHCQFCNEYFTKADVKFRIEDERFTAPYGCTFVLGGDVACVAVCNICKDDLEEIR